MQILEELYQIYKKSTKLSIELYSRRKRVRFVPLVAGPCLCIFNICWAGIMVIFHNIFDTVI